MLSQDSKLTCVNLQLNLCLNFGVEFSYLHSFFLQRHFQSCLSYIPLTRNAFTLHYLIGNRAFNIFECCFTVTKPQKIGWGGGVNFLQTWQQIGPWPCE